MGRGDRLAARRIWNALAPSNEGFDHLQSHWKHPGNPNFARPFQDREHGSIPRRRHRRRSHACREDRDLTAAGRQSRTGRRPLLGVIADEPLGRLDEGSTMSFRNGARQVCPSSEKAFALLAEPEPSETPP